MRKESSSWKTNSLTAMLTEDELQKEGLAIKEGSEPLILERWAVGADKKYHCFELPLYDISSLEEPAEALDAYSRQELPQPYQPSDMRSIKVPLLTAMRSGTFLLSLFTFWGSTSSEAVPRGESS